MTSVRWRLTALLVALALAPVIVLRGQSKPEMQMQQDIRMLQEQIQQLRLAVNALAEQTKTANSRLEAQTDLLRTNNADQTSTLKNIQTQVDALGEKVTLFSKQVTQFQADVSPIRDALERQQKTLERIQAAVEFPTPTSPANASTGTPTQTSAPIGDSPVAQFNQARNFYYRGEWEMAAKALGDFLNSPNVGTYTADANYWLGMSYMKMGIGKIPSAIAAFKTVIENYKTSDRAADAYYALGDAYDQQGNRTAAQAAYKETIKLFPETSAAMQARGRIR